MKHLDITRSEKNGDQGSFITWRFEARGRGYTVVKKVGSNVLSVWPTSGKNCTKKGYKDFSHLAQRSKIFAQFVQQVTAEQ